MNLKRILGGLKSYLPVRLAGYKGTGGTTAGNYCYAVMASAPLDQPALRARIQARRRRRDRPRRFIGLGLAALLSGTQRYHGLDVLEHASVEPNERVLGDLMRLFWERAPSSRRRALPDTPSAVAELCHPASVMYEVGCDERLSDATVEQLRAAIRAGATMERECPIRALVGAEPRVPPGGPRDLEVACRTWITCRHATTSRATWGSWGAGSSREASCPTRSSSRAPGRGHHGTITGGMARSHGSWCAASGPIT